MQNTNPEKILYGPIITEKSIAGQSTGVYSFWVNPKANKNQIASAFYIVFAIKTLSIRTMKTIGKVKTDSRKRLPIKKPNRKKAIIQVAKDQKIELLNLNTK